MALGRIYTVSFEAVAVTAAQDLWELNAPAGKACRLRSVFVGQSSDAGDAEDEMLRIRINRGSSGTTSGSGGTAPTPAKTDSGDAAASFTAEVNNTTAMVAGGGTITLLHPDTFNVRAGWVYRPTPEEMYTWSASERLTINLPVAPADSLTMSGVAIVEEIG